MYTSGRASGHLSTSARGPVTKLVRETPCATHASKGGANAREEVGADRDPGVRYDETRYAMYKVTHASDGGAKAGEAAEA